MASAAGTIPASVVAAIALAASGAAQAAASDMPRIGPVPIDFILFALHSARGRAVSSLHAARRSGRPRRDRRLQGRLHGIQDRTGPSRASWASCSHEWVILANLFLLLMGFAILSRHFEKSRHPGRPAALPAQRLERRVRAAGHGVRAVVLSRQHRGRDDRRRDGAHSYSAPKSTSAISPGSSRRRMPAGRAASIGDTTTTMMWIAGVVSARGSRGLRRGHRRARHLRHSRGEAAARATRR